MCAVPVVLLIWGTVASGQTYYTWTDQKGVVHFSDAPPPGTRFEERVLPVSPRRSSELPSEPDGDAVDDTPTAQPTPVAGEGPANVILVRREAPRTGGSSVRVMGEVKNVGGADAQQVVIAVTANDSIQGNPCLNERFRVTPSTLRGGESGKFDVHVESPCLYGNPPVDVVPSWD